MHSSTLKIAKVSKVKTPQRDGLNAGFDFFVPDNYGTTRLKVGESVKIKTGIKVRIPKGFALVAFNKSGVALNLGLQVGACVIDENYMGEIHLHLFKVSGKPILIEAGQKLVQFILLPVLLAKVEEVKTSELYKDFNNNERGENGFGSTGNF